MVLRIKGSITITIASALVVVVLAQIYFLVGLPLLNVLYNPAQPDDSHGGGTVVNRDDDIFDPNDPYYPKTPTPTNTPGPNDTENPEVTPTATQPPQGTFSDVEKISVYDLTFAEGSRNILLLGVNQDDNLADTIIIANVDDSSKMITLVSIPRDTYIAHSASVVQDMKNAHYYNLPGSCKINAVLNVGSMISEVVGGKFNNSQIDYLCAIISQLLPNCEIDDYVMVDFDGFMSIIDVIGGVRVNSLEDMYKTKNGNTYLYIRKGENFLNAEDALFYVRYRTRLDANGDNTGTGGDDYRKANQMRFIIEVADQIFTAENLTLTKFSGMLDVLKDSVYHSVTLSDLNTYLPIGLDYSKGYYSVRLFSLKGADIDPFGDHASYINLYYLD